ncbi:TIGR02147 family protein [Bdellovibrio sp. HCB337]|uniref:TIGR02147 family protein n=1 Tax=Bdellovibrio sp. HCB337 TaxID=3394358 RepID=UPI0039A52E6E
METLKMQAPLLRPVISDFEDPVDFLKLMIEYRKKTEKSFSVHAVAVTLRKVSPALVSLILSRKRKITLDRVDELSKLIQLNVQEKIYFRNWIARLEKHTGHEDVLPAKPDTHARHHKKDVGTHILNDWINVYVKDCFQLPKVQNDPNLVHRYLASYAHPKRLEKAIEFLLREGHLRRTLDGKIVVEANLAVADPKVPSKKIRQFHKGALGVAKAAIDLFPPNERMANTLIIPLNEKSYSELMEIIQDFSEKLQEFAAHNQETGDRLYQLIVNLSPTGGKVE